MVAGVRSRDIRVFAARLPVELAGLYDDAAQGRAVAAQELRRRVNHDVSAVLNGTEQIRGTEGVVHNKRKAVTVSDLSDCLNIRKIAVGVTQGLEENGSRVRLDSSLNLNEVSRINEGGGDVVLRKRVLQKVEGSAVDRLLRYDMSAVGCQSLDRVRDRCCAGGNCQCCAAAFKGCHSLLQNALRRVGEASVNVACIRKTEAVCRVLCVVEYICCRLIDRNRSRIGSGVCLFLSYM